MQAGCVSPPPKKRARKSGVESAFERDLNKDHRDDLACLRRVLEGKDKVSCLDCAYRIPLNALTRTELQTLQEKLRTIPKKAYHMGRRVDKPWDLYVMTKANILLPRPLGIMLAGVPARRGTVSAPVDFPEPLKPLLDDATAADMFKTPQVGHVAKVLLDLAEGVAKQGYGSCLYSIPTSHGKTACAVHIAARLGERTLFVTSSDSVHSLNEEEFKSFLGEDFAVGRMQTSNKKSWRNTDAMIVQTTHASAASCALDVTKFGTVIIDEAHKVATAEFKKMFFKFPCKYLVMLTATPSRASDHCGAYLQWLGGPVSCYVRINLSLNRWKGVTVREVPYEYGKTTLITEKQDERQGRTYTNLPLTHTITMYRKDRNAALVNHIVDLVERENRHVIAVGVRIAHVERIVAALKAKGVSVGALVGEFTDGRKQTQEERAETFKCRVIVAYISIAVEALNIPRIDTIMQLAGGCPWNNETFWLQFIGRAVRDKEDKNKPLIVLPRDPTTHGVFERQIDRATEQFLALGDGFEFTVGAPVRVGDSG